MIVVHAEFLAEQWKQRINQFCPGATIGRVQGNVIDIEHDFVIAMLQSLSMKDYSFKHFESIGVLIADEAHHVCAKVFSQAFFKLCPRHAFALSATPERADGLTKVLHWFFGNEMFVATRQNQSQVRVVPISFDCAEFRKPPPTTRFGKVCLSTMITELANNETRNRMIVNLIKKTSKETPSRQILVLSHRREHCKLLLNEFPDLAGLYMGGMTEAEREKSKKKPIIFGTFQQAHEGLDINTLDTAILVTPKSDVAQSVGRVLRETAGSSPLILDVVDSWGCEVLTLRVKTSSWSRFLIRRFLYAMFRKRKKVYQDKGFTIEGSSSQMPEETSLNGFHFKV